MSGNVASGAASAGGVAPLPGATLPAVDPDGREPEALRRHVVVVEALGDVEDPLAREPDPLERHLEVVRVRLVAPGRLGGHDPVERRREALGRSGEQVVVAVGDDAQPEAFVQARERRGRIGEGRPVADRIGEGVGLRRVGFHAVPGGQPELPVAEDVPVAPVGAGLCRRFQLRVVGQQLVVRSLDPAPRQHRPQAGEDPGLPVDERAVAVEGQGLEPPVVESGHDRRPPRSRPGGGRSAAIIAESRPGHPPLPAKPARPGSDVSTRAGMTASHR